MGVQPARFNSAGQSSQHYIPGVYGRDKNVPSGTGVSSGNLCIIGSSLGGKPLSMHVAGDTAEAKEILTSGSLLDAVAHAFNGSTTFVPQRVFFIRVNNGTQSSIELLNNGSTILTAKSADYGVHMNQLKMWVRDGSKEGKKILLSFKGNDFDVDNIAKKSFSIMYTGDGDSANCTINAAGLELTALKDSEEIDALKVSWDECKTLEELSLRINDSGKYAFTLIDTADESLTSDLDHVSNVSVSETDATVFNSDLKAFMDALISCKYIGEVTLADDSVRILPENNVGYVYFNGAEGGTSTVADYINALEELEKEDIQIITTHSTNTSVHTLISDHCISMSGITKKKERTFWVGTAKGVSIDEAISNSKSLNTYLGSVVMTGANANNPLLGKAEDITPAMVACKCAGIESAIGVSNPLTNKVLKVNAFDKKYKDTEIDKMIANGVTPFGENEDGDLVCIRSITCYQGNNLIQNERSMTRSVFYMNRDLRKAYSKRTGTNTAPSESDVLQVLSNKSKEWFLDDLITKSDDGEFVFDKKVRFDGDKTYLDYARFIRAPNNFMFVTATNQVYSSTIEI
ncbi:MAG: phage tail sheath subtilisin-like domain-containing protein [Treponemataceae bacterium]